MALRQIVGEDEEEQKSGATAAPQQPQTFSQLQQQGYARPPQPSMPAPNVHPMAPGAGAAAPPPPQLNSQPNIGYRPPGVTGSGTPNVGPTAGAGGFSGFDPLSEHMWGQYQNFSGGPLGNDLQTQLRNALTNPSRYDSAQAQDTFRRLSDDLMQGIDVDSSRRGVFHSSIPTAIGAREKGLLASRVAEDQARTFQQDRASAISQAMGFGGQHFDQQQQLLRQLLGYGQQSFENQMGQNRFNADEQYRNSQLELELMRTLYGGAH